MAMLADLAGCLPEVVVIGLALEVEYRFQPWGQPELALEDSLNLVAAVGEAKVAVGWASQVFERVEYLEWPQSVDRRVSAELAMAVER